MIAGLKLLLWTRIPTHHQASFLQALRDDGVDLVVHYYSRVGPERVRLGWTESPTLPEGERYVGPTLASLGDCPDWRERIHVIPGYSTRFLLTLARRLSREHVSWVHWSEPSRHWPKWYLTYPLKRYYAALINRHSLGALAIGDMAREDFMRWGVEERLIRFLPYSVSGLATPDAPATPGRTTEAARFAFVGALCHRKGIDILINAFARVLARHPRATLHLIGSDETAGRYARLAGRLGVDRAVHFSGSVPAAEVARKIADCDVLILPSRFDGWGMVVNEAASLGKAIIATESCGSARHLIVPGENGFVVRPDDAGALTAAMVRYCREPGLARLHGARSLDVFGQFTPAQNAGRLRRCLKSLGSGHPLWGGSDATGTAPGHD